MIFSFPSRFKQLSALGFGLFFCLFSSTAYACPQGPDGDGDCSATTPASASQSAKASASAGNPISIITGNKYQREIDYEGSGGIASLLFNRHYNSLNTELDTGMGLGWRHSFEVRLLENIARSTIEITQSDGRRIIFKLDGVNNKVYRAVSPSDGVISSLGNNIQRSLSDGRSIVFKGSKPIKISYPGKRAFTLQYYKNHLRKVTDHNGRSLVLNYSAGSTALANFNQEASDDVALSGHLESIVLPDDSVIRYHYDTDHNLAKVTYPDNTSRVYHYENVGFPNHLTGVTDRTGRRFATWGYTDEGRANLSTEVTKPDDDTYIIVDKDKMMNQIKQRYKDRGINLHPDIEKLIYSYVSKNVGKVLQQREVGVPGLHSEVLALNDLYNQVGGAKNIKQGYVQTFHTDGTGHKFPACNNCSGIIPNSFDILTGKNN